MFNPLASLHTNRTDWRVKVRVTRLRPNNVGDVQQGFNLILLDNVDYHIHETVRPKTWVVLEGNIVEGGIYEIFNFHTNHANGNLRPVSSLISVRFSEQTIVQRILGDDWSIPINKFEFVHLA
ncbi:hypothetical protein POM88_049594 [Heracleum sosnowskyi]|uniref:Replication protein A 70 kDa DNA-binding subunit B/D first OB fold domain-containing protein n=1 Tax=Heracleum sosnowskyi TaxID=360622 RepID=A0AAD8GYG9_9APIA|nr:hypothetical protein POM88_049594 [Heracleum sosnowskyi]